MDKRGVWPACRTWLCKRPVIWYWLPPLAWMAVIFWFSAQPQLPQAPGPFWDILIKKGAHMAEYAILVVLWWRALSTRVKRFSPLGLAWGLAVLYAISDEYHQTFVPGRHGRALDVIIDTAGATLAVLILWRMTRSRE